MAKQKLYVKNEKGRYEEYKPIEEEISNTLYRKVGNKYVPFETLLHRDTMQEGIWVVTMKGRRMVNGKYVRDLFECDKVAEVEKVPLSRLAGLLEYTEAISYDFYKWREQKRKDGFGTNAEEEVAYIVGKIFEYNENKKKENNGNEW